MAGFGYCRSRLTGRALVLILTESEGAEASVIASSTERLRETAPGDEVVLDEHLRLQRPATNFAAVTTEQSDHASARRIRGVWPAGEVSDQIAEVEVVEHQPGVRARNIEAGCALIARHQLDQADVVDERK